MKDSISITKFDFTKYNNENTLMMPLIYNYNNQIISDCIDIPAKLNLKNGSWLPLTKREKNFFRYSCYSNNRMEYQYNEYQHEEIKIGNRFFTISGGLYLTEITYNEDTDEYSGNVIDNSVFFCKILNIISDDEFLFIQKYSISSTYYYRISRYTLSTKTVTPISGGTLYIDELNLFMYNDCLCKISNVSDSIERYDKNSYSFIDKISIINYEDIQYNYLYHEDFVYCTTRDSKEIVVIDLSTNEMIHTNFFFDDITQYHWLIYYSQNTIIYKPCILNNDEIGSCYGYALTAFHHFEDVKSEDIFYVTENGDAYFKGTVYADDGVFQGDIIARSLTLGENAEVNGKVIAGSGSMGGWEIDTDCLKSVDFDATETTNGIRLDSNGEIRSKGSLYSSATGDGTEGWFARLCSGKWIFGYYDSSQSDPFIPPAGTPYSDISVNGIYICSKNTILNNVANRYLFRADAANDIDSITSNSSNPALTITNDGEGTCLEVRNNSSTYDNKALSLGVTVLNTDAEGNTSYGMGYITVFGEGVEGSAGRIIMRPDQNIKSTDTTNPANYTNSACGTKFYPWGEMSCYHLYVDETSTTSDAKLKTPIKLIDNDTALEFINGLKPREYRFKDGERLHMGFYAQEVSQLAKDLNLGDMAIYEAIMTKDGEDKEYYYDENTDDEHLHWSLKYNEFIAPMVSAIQGLSKENKELKEKMSELESRLEKLEKLLLEK